MKTAQSDYMINRFDERHIDEVLRLADVCGLARWTKKDYLEELASPDSFGFVVCLTNTSLPILAGFIIARLIKPCRINSEISNLLKDSDPQSTMNHSVGDNITAKDAREENECEILNIAVETAHRKKGIGQKMIEKTMERCNDEKVGAVWLEVRASNDIALNFYRDKGFAVIYRRKNYYRYPTDDALVMKKDLF